MDKKSNEEIKFPRWLVYVLIFLATVALIMMSLKGTAPFVDDFPSFRR
jgi:hypothetical protein